MNAQQAATSSIIPTFDFQPRLVVDPRLSDFEQVRLSWKERLFSLPWRPWVRFKAIYKPKIYDLGDGRFLCSPQSARSLRRGTSLKALVKE